MKIREIIEQLEKQAKLIEKFEKLNDQLFKTDTAMWCHEILLSESIAKKKERNKQMYEITLGNSDVLGLSRDTVKSYIDLHDAQIKLYRARLNRLLDEKWKIVKIFKFLKLEDQIPNHNWNREKLENIIGCTLEKYSKRYSNGTMEHFKNAL